MTENRDFPGNLPLLPMGWGASSLDFDGAADFDREALRITAEAALGKNLDLAMGGESSPRIWLFLHEAGQASLSAAAALEIARELGTRDQAVLLLDGDDQACSLTRWAGRQEKEGWIDLVRYGSSVLTSGVALPFAGRRAYVLGVGSFAPTDIDAQEAEDLINRLKRQADDLLIVAPRNELGVLWARVADIRLYCWDRARQGTEEVDRACDSFEDAGLPLTGLVGFGLPGETAAGAPAVETPAPQPRESEEHDGDDEGHGFDEPAAQDPDQDPAEEPDVEVEIYAAADGESLAGSETEDFAAENEEADALAGSGSGPGKGSSRVFWVTAVVSLAVIVAVSVFYLKVIRVTEPAVDNRTVAEADLNSNPQAPPAAGAESTTMPETNMDLPDEQEQASGPAGENLTGSASGAEPEATDPPAQEPAVDAADEIGDEAPGSPGQDNQETGSTPTEPVDARPEPAETASDQGAFSMDPYLPEVGSAGWALHLYSFPDSASAQDQAALLERKGFRTAIRSVEIKDKGHWFRVYVGSFSSRSEALAAEDSLLAYLKIEWARVTEF